MTLCDRLIFRFAAPTQKPETPAQKTLLEVALGIRKAEEGYDILTGFPVIKQWLGLIATPHQLDWRDPDVAHAYILGNELLDKPYSFSILHGDFQRRFGEKFNTFPTPPQDVAPHHNTHVFTYGLLTNPGASSEQKVDCLVQPFLMQDTNGTAIPANYGGAPAHLTNPFNIQYDAQNIVAAHRGAIIERITTMELFSLIKYGFEPHCFGNPNWRSIL